MRSPSAPALRLLAVLILLLAAGLPRPASAAPGSPPAATLLLPYFEVDLTGFEGLTTLFSVNNAGSQAVVAHVVVWTDWGLPTYSFDVVLAPDDVETFNLRDLFLTGFVPSTDGRGLPGCSDPVARPPIDVEMLRRRHTGRPDTEPCPGTCICHGSGRLGADHATGYLTIDVARRCAGQQTLFPTDGGYFPFSTGGVPPEPGFVANDNVLWGDVFYVAADDDSAQGTDLVQIPYDPTAPEGETFYRRYSPQGSDGRTSLGSRYRGRYFDGGPFDGGTDLLLWLESEFPTEPRGCGQPLIVDCQNATLRLFDEASTGGDVLFLPIGALAFRLAVGSDELATPAPAGIFELENSYWSACYSLPTGPLPLQAWVTTVLKAEGRYSVGLAATVLPANGP